ITTIKTISFTAPAKYIMAMGICYLKVRIKMDSDAEHGSSMKKTKKTALKPTNSVLSNIEENCLVLNSIGGKHILFLRGLIRSIKKNIENQGSSVGQRIKICSKPTVGGELFLSRG